MPNLCDKCKSAGHTHPSACCGKKFKPKHKSIDELSQEAAVNCVAIFNDFDEMEIKSFPKSIRDAWVTGGFLVARQQELDRMFNFSKFEK